MTIARQINLGIASPSPSVYSETFIRMQMERLPCRLRIHGGPVATETLPGGPIQPLRSFRGLLDTAYLRGLRGRRDGPQAAELSRRLQQRQIDVVLANYGPTASALLPVCRKLSIPLVAHFHGYDAHMESTVERHRSDYLRLGSEAAAVVVVSHRMREALVGLGMPEGKMRVLRCGADPTLFSAKTTFPETPLFFGVGRFVDKKAPYLTLLAFKRVHEQIPSARLILAGDGVLSAVTQNLARYLGLAQAVEFPGVLEPAEVARYMLEATAFVQHSIMPDVGPSRGDSEGTPVAVLEAMLAGLPVVATSHAGIGEVIDDGRTGLLVREQDVEGMAQAMMRLANDRGLASALGAAGRQEALDKYTADRYLESLAAILESAN